MKTVRSQFFNLPQYLLNLFNLFNLQLTIIQQSDKTSITMYQKLRQMFSVQESHRSDSKNFPVSNNLSLQLSELGKKVAISSIQLVQCTTDQEKFHTIIQRFNNQGIARILREEYEQSLIFLKQGERVLQYVASCGKMIDRNLIITILHNNACAHQKIYDLPKLANYLQALIYNLGVSIQNSQINQANFIENQRFFIKGTWQYGILCEYVKKKLMYGRYHLQFASLNSKNYQHETAIKYAKKSIQIYQQVCYLCDQFQNIKNQLPACFIQVNDKQKLPDQSMAQLSKIDRQLNPKNCHYYLKKVKKILSGTQTTNIMKYSDINNEYISKEFSKFSIGKAIQMTPINIIQTKPSGDLNEQCMNVQKIRKALFIAAGYFIIGTQFRLLSSASQSKNQNFKSSDQFLLSELYHIFCILLVSTYVPCQTLFLKNLITSYKNHYEMQLQISPKKTTRNNHEALENKESIPIQTLPQHSSIQQGESKWSKSQLKNQSPEPHSEGFLPQHKKIHHEKTNIALIKRNNNVGVQYKANIKYQQSMTSLGKMIASERDIGSFRLNKKLKQQNSLLKTSNTPRKNKNSNSNSQKKTKKKSQKKNPNKIVSIQYKMVNEVKPVSKLKTKIKSKEILTRTKQSKSKQIMQTLRHDCYYNRHKEHKRNSKVGGDKSGNSEKKIKRSNTKKSLETRKKTKNNASKL